MLEFFLSLREFDVEDFPFWFERYIRLSRTTYDEFAKKIGTDPLTVKNMANGKLPPSEHVLKGMGAWYEKRIKWNEPEWWRLRFR